jgi:hypothetical protein
MKYAIALTILFFGLLAAANAQDLDDATHIVIVGADAPASDVVFAANFAASMKATQGVTYQSALDIQAQSELDESDLDAKTIVVINAVDERAKIIGDDDVAAQYLRNEGFEVRMIKNPTLGDLSIDTWATPTRTSGATDADGDNGTGPTLPPKMTVESNGQAEDAPRAAAATNPNITRPVETPTQTPDQKPGFFVRIARWFASIF